MHITTVTLASILLAGCGAVIATPVLIQGFKRRGKGIRYESSFLIQRAPQLASLLDILLVTASFLAVNKMVENNGLSLVLSTGLVLPPWAQDVVAWAGVAIFFSGLIFMIGGWYSLGRYFSTDVEILKNHAVHKEGLFAQVMHPAYSGIIQSLVGASLASLSLFAFLFTILVVAPLWLRRAKQEERLLIEMLGESYLEYGRQIKWRRLVPKWFPVGM